MKVVCVGGGGREEWGGQLAGNLICGVSGRWYPSLHFQKDPPYLLLYKSFNFWICLHKMFYFINLNWLLNKEEEFETTCISTSLPWSAKLWTCSLMAIYFNGSPQLQRHEYRNEIHAILMQSVQCQINTSYKACTIFGYLSWYLGFF